MEVTHLEVNGFLHKNKELHMIYHFNGIWPCIVDLFQWINSKWAKDAKVFMCSIGFFKVVFPNVEEYLNFFTNGPQFLQENVGLLCTPQFLDFDPYLCLSPSSLFGFHIPQLPIHFWHLLVFKVLETLQAYSYQQMLNEQDKDSSSMLEFV